jgi:hypothetical protein
MSTETQQSINAGITHRIATVLNSLIHTPRAMKNNRPGIETSREERAIPKP